VLFKSHSLVLPADITINAQPGDREAAAQLQALPERFEKAGFARLARRLRAALLQQQIVEAARTGAEPLKKAVDTITKFIASGPAGPAEAELAITVSQVLERSNHRELAIAANRDLAKLLEKSEVRSIARLAKQLEGMARRLELPGRAMPLEGTMLDGKPLSWDAYRGKVVLVSFWATWCAPCRQEIKSIRKNYEAYHSRGFEVVAISVDEDRDELETFVKENHLPWPVVVDHARRGAADKSMAPRYGVMSIPQVILVNKDGIVVATEVRGPALDEHLEKLLGPPELKKEADAGK
jgi:peroxiredoxin